MGDTHDVLSEGLDEALPETETEAVVETEETETPAPDVSETEDVEEAVQETETETETEEGDRLAPLFGRLKDISDNDREMISRHYERARERDAIQEQYEEAQRRIAELEGRDTFSDQAERIFESVRDPQTRQMHEEFRATHTDKEYVLAVERQRTEDQYREPPPEEDPRDKAMREMQYRLDQIEAAEKARAAERGKELLREHSAKALGELKVPEKYHDFLVSVVVDARNASVTPITTYNQLRELAKAKWAAFEPHLKSEQAATKAALKKKTTKVAKPEDEPEEELVTDDLEKFEDSESLFKHGLDAAIEVIPESGAA
jgi:hypothetical protein